MFYEATKKVIKFFDDYPTILSKAKCGANHGKGLKILAPKQILQILLISLARVKAGNTSENLLNVTRQIMCSFYWEKEVTNKAHNNIINSIK